MQCCNYDLTLICITIFLVLIVSWPFACFTKQILGIRGHTSLASFLIFPYFCVVATVVVIIASVHYGEVAMEIWK